MLTEVLRHWPRRDVMMGNGHVIGFSLNPRPRGGWEEDMAAVCRFGERAEFWHLSCFFFPGRQTKRLKKISCISAPSLSLSMWHGASWDRGQRRSEHTFPTPSFQHSHVQLLLPRCFATGCPPHLCFFYYFSLSQCERQCCQHASAVITVLCVKCETKQIQQSNLMVRFLTRVMIDVAIFPLFKAAQSLLYRPYLCLLTIMSLSRYFELLSQIPPSCE